MLHDRAPEIDFAVDTASLVAKLAQVLKVLRRVHAAGAVGLRNLVGIMHSLRTPNDGSDDSRSPASSRQRLGGMPPLPAERLQPRVFPLPNTVANDRRNVVGNGHRVAGTCSGSGSDAGIGSGLGSAVGSYIGSSRGSTMMVRSGSPICIISSQFSCCL